MMFRLSVILALTSIFSASAAPTSADVARVDELLVLDGTVLKFDPAGGLNETTSSQAWQLEYIKSVDFEKINEIYQKQQNHDEISLRRDVEGGLLAKRGGKECVRKKRLFIVKATN